MSMKIRCRCGVALPVSQEMVGKKIRCSQCKSVILVNAPAPVRRPSSPAPQPAPTYQSRQVNLGGRPRSTSKSWKKQTVGSNQTLIKVLSITTGVVGLIVVAVIGAVTFSKMINDGSETISSGVANSIQQNNLQNGDSEEAFTTSVASSASVKDRASQSASAQSVRKRNVDSSSESSDSMSYVDLIEVVEPSVVRIDVYSDQGNSIGSGVFVNSEGLIVTNYHVVQGASTVTVTTNDGEIYNCNGFLHVDPLKDLAVIKVDPTELSITPLQIAQTLPRKGETVATFGSPMGFNFSSTKGTVSSIRTGEEIRKALIQLTTIDVYSILGYSEKTSWIQMSAAISGGNSGGPLVNMRGELVGINTFTHPGGQNLNFASTFEEVISVVEAASTSEIKNFKQLPVQRILIEMPEGDRRNDVASSNGNRGQRSRPSLGDPARDGGRGTTGRSGSPDGVARVLTPEESRLVLNQHEGTLKVVPSESDIEFASDNEDGVIRSLEVGNDAVMHLSLSADERYLAATDSNGTVSVIDNQQNGKLLYQIKSFGRLIRQTTFVSGPTRLITGRDGGMGDLVHIHNVETGAVMRGLAGIGHDRLRTLTASHDGHSIFAATDHRVPAVLWRYKALEDRYESLPIRARSSFHNFGLNAKDTVENVEIRCGTISSNGYALWVCGDNGWLSRVQLAEARSPEGYRIPNGYSHKEVVDYGYKLGHGGAILDVAISSDGRVLVAGTAGGWTHLVHQNGGSWSSNNVGKIIMGEILDVSISTDDEIFATIGADKKIKLYKLKNGKLINQFSVPVICTSVKFFNDDQYLFAAGRDGKIRVYPVDRNSR